MPKAYDVKQNYYADLELPTSATVDEVKKQYRRLALLYHPDRNTGKEEEFIPKFRAIQAAHEILGDATQKARYDADRRKAGLYPTSSSTAANGSAPRGNPYQATSAYPPPPRRTQPGTYQRPPTSMPGSAPRPTGADRFTNFPRPAPTAKRPDAAQDHTNMFRAWQNMNNAQTRQSQPQPPPQPQPQPPPQSQSQSRYSTAGPSTSSPRPQPPQPPPRNTDTNFPSDEKIRAGFNHRNAPPAWDESKTEDLKSAWQAYNQKQFGSKPGVSRSNTFKTPKKGGFDPNTPGSDERAASGSHYVHRHKSEDLGRPVPPPPPGPPPASQPTSPMSPPTQPRPFANPLKPTKSRTTDEDVPYSEGNRVRTPYSSFIGERLDFSGGMKRSNSTRDATKLRTANTANRARSTSPLTGEKGTQGEGDQKKAQQKPAFEMYSSSEASSESSSSTPDAARSKNTPFASSPKTTMPPQQRPKKVPSPPSKRFNSTTNPFAPPTNGTDGGSSEPDAGSTKKSGSSNIFSFPIGPDTFSPTVNSKSRSEENIRVNFSDGFPGTFAGSSEYFPPQLAGKKPGSPSQRNRQRANVRSATANYPSPGAQTTGFNMPPPPQPASATSGAYADAQTVGGEAAFSKEQWEKAFKDGSWTFPPPPPKPASPTKGGVSKAKAPVKGANRANTKAARAGTASNPHVVDDEAEASEEVKGRDSGVRLEDDDAMDIDNTPPVAPQPAQQDTVTPQKEPRMVSVPPSTWRQQQQPASTYTTSPTSPRAEPRLNTNLDDLAHVEPIARSVGTGLKNFSDLSSNLPFQSQAEPTLPSTSLAPQPLRTPMIPVAPPQPTRLSKATWQKYAQDFGTYLRAFHTFNTAMVAHFQARESATQELMAKGTAWLEATGDPAGAGLTAGMVTGPSGWRGYMQGVKEDERVREIYNLGHERHSVAVGKFEDVRERVRKLVIGGSLAER